ncbi:MAG: hypothetical protein GY756_23505 [bacterium]|nr:hypothetical protein [bacterium]
MLKYKVKQKLYLLTIFSLTALIVYFSGKTIQINLDNLTQNNYKQQINSYLKKSNSLTSKNTSPSEQIKISSNLRIKINSVRYNPDKTKINDTSKYIIAEILGITHLIISK